MIPEVMQLHSCFATIFAYMVAYCNIRKDLLEQHAICALHCVVYFMLHLYARLFYVLACVCAFSSLGQLLLFIYTTVANTVADQAGSICRRKINLLLVR